MSADLSYLKPATTKLLNLSTAHVSQETCDAASAGAIPWAVTYKTVHGFFAYCHEERETESHDDLWAVLQFAVQRGYHYVLFDADAEALDQSVAGLQLFDW